MKSLMTLALSALLISAVFGAEKECFTPTPSDYWIWGTKSENYQITKLSNGAKASITGQQDPKSNPHSIQFRVVKQAGLPIGKYRLSFQGKSNRDITVPVSIMFEKKPWWGCYKEEISFKANTPQTVELQFQIKEHMAGKALRTPSFNLGVLPLGTEFEVTGLQIFRIE